MVGFCFTVFYNRTDSKRVYEYIHDVIGAFWHETLKIMKQEGIPS